MSDVVALCAHVKRLNPSVKSFGYVAGAHVPYLHPQTGKLVDELEHLRKHPRVVIVPMSSVQGDDVAAIKQMLYEKV